MRSVFSPPELVFIRLREQCNARCQMCSFWESPDGDGLSPEQVLNIVRDLTDCGVKEVTFTGGEPFYYPALDALLDRLISLPTPPAVSIITNGSRRDGFARRVLSYPRLVRVHVSLDDVTDEGMLAIRGRKDWYHGILDFVRLIREIAPETKVVANAIVNRHSWDRLERYLEHDFDAVNFLLLKGNKSLEMALDQQTAAATAARLTDLFSSNPDFAKRLYAPFTTPVNVTPDFADYVWGGASWSIPCVLTRRLAYIDQHGDMYPCNCLAHDQRTCSLGNVLREGFSAVWKGAGGEFRERCSNAGWQTCAGCDPANRLYNLAVDLQRQYSPP